MSSFPHVALHPVFTLLLMANVATALAATIGLFVRGNCYRLVSLRVYLIYIIVGPGTVGMHYLLSWRGLSQAEYITASWIICLVDNALLMLLALDLTSWLIPKLKMFVGLWAGGITTVVTLLHFAELPAGGTVGHYWFLSRSVNWSVLAVMLLLFPGRYVVPAWLWRRDYGWVAAGITLLAAGNIALNTIPLDWMLRWPMLYGVSVPSVALASNLMFARAAWVRLAKVTLPADSSGVSATPARGTGA